MILLTVKYFPGKRNPILMAIGHDGKYGSHTLMHIRRNEADLNDGRFKNYLTLPHSTFEEEQLKYPAYCFTYKFSYVVEWADNTEGNWFVQFTDITNGVERFTMWFELPEDVLLFRMMFPECTY